MTKQRPDAPQPWDGTSGGLREAIRAYHLAARRAPTEADRPPPSLFPMTRGARAARRMARAGRKARPE